MHGQQNIIISLISVIVIITLVTCSVGRFCVDAMLSV